MKALSKLSALLLPLLLAAPALAQDFFEDTRGVSVTDRPRPDYDPLGIRAGAFLVLPELTLGLEYNDNIYATKDNEKSDIITIIAPQVNMRSDWTRHAVAGSVGLRGGIYGSESDLNYLDGFALLNTRLDVLRESYLETRLGFMRQHEDPGDPDFQESFKEPAVFNQSFIQASYFHGLGRTSLRGGGGFTNFDYHSVKLRDGTSLSQNNRDRNIYDLNLRVSYELLPNVQPFIEGRYDWRRYSDSQVRRDSDGLRLGLGTGFDLGGVTTGEIFGGYLHQDYTDQDNFSAPWYGMSLLWNVTQLTSVQAEVIKSVKETTQPLASGIDSVDAGLRLDHELLRNLLVGVFFNFTRDDYKGTDVTEDYYTVGPRVTYLWNRNFKAEFEYGYTRKTRDEMYNDNYAQNRFFVSLSGSF